MPDGLTMPDINKDRPVIDFIFNVYIKQVLAGKEPFSSMKLSDHFHEFVTMSERLKLARLCIRSVLSTEHDLSQEFCYRIDMANYNVVHTQYCSKLELVGVHEHVALDRTCDRIKIKINAHPVMKNQLKMIIEDFTKYFGFGHGIIDLWICEEMAEIETYGETIINPHEDICLDNILEITQDHYNMYIDRYITFWLQKIATTQCQMQIAHEKGEPKYILGKFCHSLWKELPTCYTEKGIVVRCIVFQLHRYLKDIAHVPV
jgi:hypothetical protein